MKRISKILLIIILIILFSIIYNQSQVLATIQGDVDQDGNITVNDLAKLKLHLVDIEKLENESLGDIDNDGRVSINDLAILKLILVGLKDNLFIKDTSFDEYKFNQITPENNSVTFERVIMTSKLMEPYGSSGAGSQWPISLEVSKDGNLMLNGTDVVGIHKSTDHGKTWEPSNIGFECRGVGMFAIDPHNNTHTLALGISTWIQNGGIYCSYDTATTWHKGFSFACKGIRYLWDGLEFDPTTFSEETGYTMDVYFSSPYDRDRELRTSSTTPPKLLSVLKPEEVGLYKSTDGGESFELIINDVRVADGIVKITDNGKIYIGNQYGLFLIDKENNKIEKSYLENNPEENYSKGITGLDVVGNTIYAQTWDGIFTLTEDGTLTKITSDDNYEKSWPQFLEVSEKNPDHMIYMYRENPNNVYTIEAKATKDGGKTWYNSKFIVNSSFYKLNGRNREKVFIMDPSDENNIITFAGYNLERSSDGGETFTQIAGISNTMQGGKFNFNYYNPNVLLFSAQDYTGAVTIDGGKYYTPLKIPGKGNLYGGFAADEKTYFGFANETWWGGTLSVTHDAGRSWTDFGLTVSGVPGTPYYSCMQSYTDPNVLFAAEYYSKDKGYTWNKMNGCVSVFTINYTGKHEIYGGDENGNLVVSYDNGDTWKILNSKPFYTGKTIAKETRILDIAYDQVNNFAYIVLNLEKENSGNLQYVYKLDINNDISTEIKFPKDNYRGTMRIKTIAIDPNSVNVLYIGGSGDYYCSATGLIRSLDGGNTWDVLTNANDEHFKSIATNQGGYEVCNVRVNPLDGKLWISCGCYGYEIINPPYDNSKLTENKIVNHTIKYVYNDKLLKTTTITNGLPHNFVPSLDGLEFVDWYTDKEFKNSYSNDTPIFNSMILYGKFNQSKKLELIVNDTIFKSIDLDKYDSSIEEFIPIKDGYVFEGWYKNKELTIPVEDIELLNDSTTLYAGWYKASDQIFDPNTLDLPVYIAYSDQKIQSTRSTVDNIDFVENRSVPVSVDKNSSYLIRFKMDTRFRMGLAKTQFWSYSTVSDYYINEHDDNSTKELNKYVSKVIDTTTYSKLLIFYYTSTGSRDFMDIKNTMKIYKLESKDLIYNF